MTENNSIIFNVAEHEVSLCNMENSSSLWQRTALEKVTTLLISTLKDAQTYREIRKKDKSITTTAHNAIFISGGRGAGKSVFLRNIGSVLKKKDNLYKPSDSDNLAKICFLPFLDPTLLREYERFSNVVVAQLYNQVIDKFKNSTIEDGKRSEFYQKLRALANALTKTSEFDDNQGIDSILRYTSGIQVERLFHDFIENCLEFLHCDAIVVAIDDIDMMLDGADKVLDDIRRFLSCPYIITIASGDMSLYTDILNTKHAKVFEKNTNLAENRIAGLSEAYLTKLFPSSYRIDLLPIDLLLQKLTIQEPNKKESDKPFNEYSFNEYEEKLKAAFYSLCNGLEKSTQWSHPATSREFVQLLQLLPLSDIDGEKTIDTARNPSLWDKYQQWAKFKGDGMAYTNMASKLTLCHRSENTPIRLEQLMAFNPKSQIAMKGNWLETKDFHEEQITGMTNETGALHSKALTNKTEQFNTKTLTNKTEQFNTKIFTNKTEQFNTKIFTSVFKKGHQTLRSMPFIETVSTSFQTKQQNSKNQDNFILLYTHNEYYSKSLNRRPHVFFGRAFEILALSLLRLNGEITFQSSENWTNTLSNIFSTAPFYSIFSINPTVVDDGNDDGSDDSSDNGSDNNSKRTTINNLDREINEWIQKHPLGSQQPSLIPLLHSVFNKIFTQLNILRDNPIKESESLYTVAKRFEYIVINAFASFINTAENVTRINVALGATIETIANWKKFASSDRTLTNNIAGLVTYIPDTDSNGQKPSVKIYEPTPEEAETALSPCEHKYRAKLLEAIWKHPIFAQNYDEKLSNGAKNMLLGKDDGKENTKASKLKKETTPSSKKIDKPSLKKAIDTFTAAVSKSTREEDIVNSFENFKIQAMEACKRKIWFPEIQLKNNIKLYHQLYGSLNSELKKQRNIIETLEEYNKNKSTQQLLTLSTVLTRFFTNNEPENDQ